MRGATARPRLWFLEASQNKQAFRKQNIQALFRHTVGTMLALLRRQSRRKRHPDMRLLILITRKGVKVSMT